MWNIRFVLALVGWGAIKHVQHPSMVLAAASTTGLELPEEYSYAKAICFAQDQVRTDHQHSGFSSKDPNTISLSDVLGLDPYQKPFHPLVESLSPDGKNWKEAKEALESTRVDWEEAKMLLRNKAMSDQEVVDVLINAANETALLNQPDSVVDKLAAMAMKYMVHNLLSHEGIRLIYQWKFLPFIERPGALQKFCNDVLVEANRHDEL
ncbi:hypothetical protein FVEN_g8821 [Fusarium venenatum]|uniref:Uncharacterized protein n=1 Tax=Fusarium venenatum TaxID=56646 RepID=A0A2L2TVH0_9HYPO|nr:uncharacterized protein FVRRES_02072 [Fusarium venenatum]KAG8353122.1 hypothetical protein FVEN_g8821 [Fusarium venenatum]CEI65560.1 unnamed protein product [Fusarium venenatum]